MIYGIGIDIVDIGRIKKVIDKWGERFTSRIYSKSENDYCKGRAFPHIHFAARFAAKESFLKSVGMGMGSGVNFNDIEVIVRADGKPELKFYGKASIMLCELNIDAVHISISHTNNYAAAAVVAEKSML